MAKRPTCICGRLKVDGRCTAFPSCDDFCKPHQTANEDDARARAELKKIRVALERVPLRGKVATAAARRADPGRRWYRREMSMIITKAKRGAG